MGSGPQDSRDIEIRAIGEGEIDAWNRALDASFLLATPDGAVAFMKELYAPGRSLGAISAGRCVGTFRSLDLEVTVPGGFAVRAEGVTNVAVVAGHRRRGLLSRMMRAGLDDAVARGHSLAALIASEYRIYGRFGFGPATRAAGCEIDVRRAGGIRVPGADDPLPLLLDNPRACVPQAGAGGDHLWLRILDVVRALEARTYDAPGRLVLDITDRLGYASGRFALQARHDGTGSVTPVGEPADLTMDVSALGTLYLGDQTMHRLAAAGLVAEQRTGAVSRADRMLRTAARPWCPDGF